MNTAKGSSDVVNYNQELTETKEHIKAYLEAAIRLMVTPHTNIALDTLYIAIETVDKIKPFGSD